ncbi:MAG: FAD binding domain-containing protein [FCB group bacterium]|nr:FAD binding domain-containing protein [FCB group bacterium]MBL7027168.1 FAD binding domain-containing protein [Candidatus Neomarinimicrobiota bacterium]MBL7120597.1 FAD binding domain-containing protein [Candidatus Neomarinimicrobiota bacterium]
MWSSIEQILKPDTLSEACVLLKESGSALFAGGTYLVSQKDANVHTLLDINHLLNDQIEMNGEEIHIDAGCTLQEIVNFGDERLNGVILSACPSKNIRNQRTIGGEVARSRLDSDMLVFLFAAGTKLLLSHSEALIELSTWDGNGIIVKIIIPPHEVKLERVALLDSAPAYVIVGLNELNDPTAICVGGKISKIMFFQTRPEPAEADVQKFMDVVEASFSNDHLGTQAYKRHLVSVLLQEMAVSK